MSISYVELSPEGAGGILVVVELSNQFNGRIALALESVGNLVRVDRELSQVFAVSNNVNGAVQFAAVGIKFDIKIEYELVAVAVSGVGVCLN